MRGTNSLENIKPKQSASNIWQGIAKAAHIVNLGVRKVVGKAMRLYFGLKSGCWTLLSLNVYLISWT